MKSPELGDGSGAKAMDVALEQLGLELRAGNTLSQINIEGRFPQLMPELADRARDLQLIINAERDINPSSRSSKIEARKRLRVATLDAALDGYKVTRQISKGGQGIVFGALQESTQRDVAIKVMTTGELSNANRARRFAREIRLASGLDLPNIVPVIDSGIVDGQPYLVMPMAYGLSVDEYAELSIPTVRGRVEMVSKIARAVGGAHKKRIIHRDLKPSNILVDQHGEPQILDFGLAKALTSEGVEFESTLSALGQIMGTLPYLSPEQASGEPNLDERSDVYALGVLLFTLLTGGYPYDIEFGGDVARKNILETTPRSLKLASQQTGGAPGLEAFQADDRLQAIVSMAIAKDRESRYQSADALSDDLQNYLTGESLHANVVHRSTSNWKTLLRLGIPLVVLIVGLGLWIWFSN
ncbi:MAG: serine/threonine protein kinase [Phycisphaerales bacterium]|nr:serine/threonine protein kinase [Phycisphaerales bacterium]